MGISAEVTSEAWLKSLWIMMSYDVNVQNQSHPDSFGSDPIM